MKSVLVLLKEVVPLIPGWIEAGKVGFDIYDKVRAVIAEHRSPNEPEWSSLEMQIARDQAAVRDTSRDVRT